MMTTTTPATMIYKGFKISFNDPAEKTRHMKTVDDYETDQLSIIMYVDAARIALSHTTACRLLQPMSADQANFLKRITIGCEVGSLAPALAPNRIEARHFTKSSRVRTLVHGGTLGALAMKLLDEPNRERRSHKRSRTFHSWHIIRRVNSQAGCEHVRWSIPEFQCRYNIGVRNFKNKKGPFEHMSIDDTLAQLTAMNTAETRQKFMDECKAVANHVNHSRVKCTSVVHEDEFTKCDRQFLLTDGWISEFISAFTKVCSHKMSIIGDNSLSLIDRAKHIVDLFRFMSTHIDWILMDCNLRFVCKLNTLWPKYLERLVYMSQEGIEHAACMLIRHFPEMMTPELHVLVKPSERVYRVPAMQIADDDALFGPLKLACQGLLPDAIVPNPNPVRARAFYESDDEFDRDYEDEYYSDEDEDEDDYSDNAQG
jgi:hypothetical protein